MKIKLQWSMREAYLLDKLEKNTIGKLKQTAMKVKTKFQNIMEKITTKTMTAGDYDDLWATLEDKLDDLYSNEPDAYDLENYEFELSGNEISIEEIKMGYDHFNTASQILKLLVEEGVIKIKNKK